MTPLSISLSSLGSFFLWWLAKSGALPLELSNAPILVIKEAKKARAQAKTKFPNAHFARVLQEFVSYLARPLQKSDAYLARFLQDFDAYLERIVQEFDAYLARILQDRCLSCKILAYPTAILQDLARILQDLARWCVILQDSCKILARSCKIAVGNRLGRYMDASEKGRRIKI